MTTIEREREKKTKLQALRCCVWSSVSQAEKKAKCNAPWVFSVEKQRPEAGDAFSWDMIELEKEVW